MKVCLIPPGFVAGMYHDIIPFLSRLAPTTNGRYDAVDLYNNLVLNKESLWTVVDDDEKIMGIILTQLHNYPQKKVFCIQYAAGDGLDDCIDEALDILEKTAVRHGCNSMQVMGRRGWVKKLQSYDWKEEFVIVSKDLKEDG